VEHKNILFKIQHSEALMAKTQVIIDN